MEPDTLYSKWERDSWRERWLLGMEPDEAPLVERICPSGWWRRFAAWMVDSLLMWLVSGSLFITLITVGLITFPLTDNGLLLMAVMILLIVILLKNAYYTLLHTNNGQTIGKAVLGIKVIDAEGNAPSLRQSLRRGSAHFLSFILLGFGYLWMLVDPEQQTLHDKLAGTYVVMA